MSTRERWVVYPLLFLAIGLATRNEIIQVAQEKQLETGVVKCKAIEADVVKCKGIDTDVVRSKGIDTGVVKCKGFEVVDANDKPRVIIETGDKDGGGSVELISAKGKRLAVLNASETGSGLTFLDDETKAVLVLDNHKNPRIFDGILDQSGNVKRVRNVWFFDPPSPAGELTPSKRNSSKEKSKPSPNSDAGETEKAPD